MSLYIGCTPGKRTSKTVHSMNNSEVTYLRPSCRVHQRRTQHLQPRSLPHVGIQLFFAVRRDWIGWHAKDSKMWWSCQQNITGCLLHQYQYEYRYGYAVSFHGYDEARLTHLIFLWHELRTMRTFWTLETKGFLSVTLKALFNCSASNLSAHEASQRTFSRSCCRGLYASPKTFIRQVD